MDRVKVCPLWWAGSLFIVSRLCLARKPKQRKRPSVRALGRWQRQAIIAQAVAASALAAWGLSGSSLSAWGVWVCVVFSVSFWFHVVRLLFLLWVWSLFLSLSGFLIFPAILKRGKTCPVAYRCKAASGSGSASPAVLQCRFL